MDKGEFKDLYGHPYTSVLVRHQAGRGVIGDWFRGMFSFVRPLISKGAKAASKELLSSGSKMLGELATSTPDQKASDIVKRNLREGGNRALRQSLKAMSGSGRMKKKKKTPKRVKKQTGRGLRKRKKQVKKPKYNCSNSLKRDQYSSASQRGRSSRRVTFEPDIFG